MKLFIKNRFCLPVITVLFLVLFFADAGAGVTGRGGCPGQAPVRPVHTYSIVARDSVTGEFGVAVQSHWYSVGSVVAWAEAGGSGQRDVG